MFIFLSEVIDHMPLEIENIVCYQCGATPTHSTRVVRERLLEIFRDKAEKLKQKLYKHRFFLYVD